MPKEKEQLIVNYDMKVVLVNGKLCVQSEGSPPLKVEAIFQGDDAVNWAYRHMTSRGYGYSIYAISEDIIVLINATD